MATYIGIEIGGTKLQIVSGDRNARITERFSFQLSLRQERMASGNKLKKR